MNAELSQRDDDALGQGAQVDAPEEGGHLSQEEAPHHHQLGLYPLPQDSPAESSRIELDGDVAVADLITEYCSVFDWNSDAEE
jgi:hypothetical protein